MKPLALLVLAGLGLALSAFAAPAPPPAVPATTTTPTPTTPAATAASQTQFAAPVNGTVTATSLYVRARPSAQGEVVGQLRQNDAVQAVCREVNREGEWLGIFAPKTAEAWLPARVLNGNVVIAEHTPVYSGKGIEFSSYARMEADAKVVIRPSQGSEWVRIEPPTGAVVWVSARYVRLPQPPKPPPPEPVVQTPEPKSTPPAPPTPVVPAPAVTPPTPAPVTPVVHTPPPPAPKLDVNPVPGLPTQRSTLSPVSSPLATEVDGVVVPLGQEARPFSFALAAEVNGHYHPIFFFDQADTTAPNWIWKHVRISGKRVWMYGWPRPVLRTDTIGPWTGER